MPSTCDITREHAILAIQAALHRQSLSDNDLSAVMGILYGEEVDGDSYNFRIWNAPPNAFYRWSAGQMAPIVNKHRYQDYRS